MSNLKGKVAIIGIGQVPAGKYPDRPAITSAVQSARMAIQDSGIQKDEIEAVIASNAFFNAWYNADLAFSRLVEELGLTYKCKCNMRINSGGASSSTMLKIASGLVVGGMADPVLCVHSEKWGSADLQAIVDQLATLGIPEEWEGIHGLCYNAVAGLITQRYMYETGTTKEQLASVIISMRKWAALNPNAMLRRILTVEEVLGSKMVATPLHRRECNVLADGGSAFIVTSAERARSVTRTPVYILGESGRVVHYSLAQDLDLTREAWAEAGKEAFEQAGITHRDIDIAEFYDSYSVFPLIMLEELGFCKRGEAGKFVQEGHTWPGGDLPMTTNGGMLAEGHLGTGGGVSVLVESVRQLMGKAGERQVKDANIAVETAVGGTYMDCQVTVLGKEA